MATASLSDELLTEQQTAEILGVNPGTLSVWRSNKRYAIAYVKVGHLVRYRRSAIDAWLASRTITAESI